MKPIAIFRHSPGEGPGYFATFLDRHSIPYVLVKVDAGDPVPSDPAGFSGLCFMGGPMSVNDDLPWISRELELIRAAVAAGVPCIGHCLGGQLMAKALGGTVSRNPVKEIGWGETAVTDSEPARAWFGGLRGFLSFHWHGETFTIPPGATAVLSSRYCANQGFVLGPHLGLQCHVEMTEAMIRLWNRQWADEVNGNPGPSVQTPEQMYADMDGRLMLLHEVADRLYSRWIEGLPLD
ncbi:MAG TPA: type 1 glutamine amidotransferase [Rhodocyclaceae bacterium]|nr:type 1 glutamine amidotransferase [Rhodocyclaceae bacterium]